MYQILRVQNTSASRLLDLNCRFLSGTAISGASTSFLVGMKKHILHGIEDMRNRRIWIYCVWFQENSRFNMGMGQYLYIPFLVG